MDSFFVSIEERDAPELKGKPVAVGGQHSHRGVISTANYIAREFGVHSAMSTQLALKRCPDLIVLPTNMDKYREASNSIRDIFFQYSSIVEPLSLDEAYIDVTNVSQCHGSATWIAQEIRQKIHQTVNLTASAGISINKFVAKVASDWNKPNGQWVVPPEHVDAFVAKLPIKKIFGVGPKTAQKLHLLGINTCQDLRLWTESDLIEQFNSFGSRLYQLCRGIDEREVEPDRTRKSISVEETFSKDLSEWEHLNQALHALLDKLTHRIAKHDNKDFKKVFLKVKYHDFQISTIEKISSQLSFDELHQMLQDKLASKHNLFKIRLLGIGVRLNTPTIEKQSAQMQLFSQN